MNRLHIVALFAAAVAFAQQPPNIAGVYQSIPNSVTLPGGLKNSGSPNDVQLTPAAAQQSKTIASDRSYLVIGPNGLRG